MTPPVGYRSDRSLKHLAVGGPQDGGLDRIVLFGGTFRDVVADREGDPRAVKVVVHGASITSVGAGADVAVRVVLVRKPPRAFDVAEVTHGLEVVPGVLDRRSDVGLLVALDGGE